MVNPAGGMQEMIQKYWDFVDAKNIEGISSLIDPNFTGSYRLDINGQKCTPVTRNGKEAFLESISDVFQTIEKKIKRELIHKPNINPNIMEFTFDQELVVKKDANLFDLHSKGRQKWTSVNTNGNLLLCALKVIETEQTIKPHEEPAAGGRTCILQ